MTMQYLGYERFDDPRLVKLLNELYQNEWYYFVNMFLPSFKLIKKERIGSKIKKKYADPKTPLEKLLESKEIKSDVKDVLRLQYKNLNPYELENEIQETIRKIFSLLRI